MKTIFINGRFLTHAVTGVQRYGREMLRALDLLLATDHSSIKVEILVPHSAQDIPDYRYIRVRKVGFLSGHAWEQIELPLHSFRGILFTPGGGAPIIHPRNIVTIHDAAVFAAPSGYSYAYRKWYGFLYRFLCHTALRVVTVSTFSKRELVQWCGANPNKITVIYLGCEHAKAVAADDRILARNGLKKSSYLLAVSSQNPNKNFDRMISSLEYLGMPEIEAVVAGKKLTHIFAETSMERTSVKDVGYVTDQELRSLYENAACFVFPSLYEGFGLPPLEAISLGCPAIVSNAASMPEIFGEMALLCDPYDPKDIAGKIRKAVDLSGDAASRERLAEDAARYNWKKCAYETWALLRLAAQGELRPISS